MSYAEEETDVDGTVNGVTVTTAGRLTEPLALTHSLSRTHSLTHALALSHALARSHTRARSLARTRSLSRTHARTRSHARTHTKYRNAAIPLKQSALFCGPALWLMACWFVSRWGQEWSAI